MENNINQNIYQKLLQVIPDLPEQIAKGKYYGKSKSEGFMDLNYDYLGKDKDGHHMIALSHYFEMNGDLVPDPDMEIRIIPEHKFAEALSFQNQLVYTSVHDMGKVNLRVQNDLNEFLEQWLTNAIDQGHRIKLSEIEKVKEQEHDQPEKEIDDLRNSKDDKSKGTDINR